MPVTEQTPVNTHDGNGVTTVFAYSFLLLKAVDIEVTVNGVVVTTGYSVSGVGNPSGGSVTFVSAPAAGVENVVLRRAMTYSRTDTDYQDNGDLLAGTLDNDIDRVIMMVQQLAADFSRALKLSKGTTADQSVSQTSVDRVGKIVSFDADGNMVLRTPVDLSFQAVTAFMSSLLESVDESSARVALGLEIGTMIQAYSAVLQDIANRTGPLRIDTNGHVGFGAAPNSGWGSGVTALQFSTDGGIYRTTTATAYAQNTYYDGASIKCLTTGTAGVLVFPTSGGASLRSYASATADTTPTAMANFTLSTAGDATLVTPNGGLGYGTGAGGTVTQATSRTTAVTLNKPSGEITLFSAAGSTTWQSFTVNNTLVAATDHPTVIQKSGADLYEIHVTNVASGSFRISFRTTGGTTTEQPVFRFDIAKGASA